MPSSIVNQGVNDLQTVFPAIAKEADGWDPTTVRFSSHKKMPWKCTAYGHTWKRTVNQRTSSGGRGCPYCAGKEVWQGFNDLKTKFPEIAAEADGWDPSLVTFASGVVKPWKCTAYAHTWEETPKNRCLQGDNCPYCSNKRVLKGFNDLQTKFPEIAAEADGWDPSTVTPGSSRQKRKWKCKKCLKPWRAIIKSRTSSQSGCPR